MSPLKHVISLSCLLMLVSCGYQGSGGFQGAAPTNQAKSQQAPRQEVQTKKPSSSTNSYWASLTDSMSKLQNAAKTSTKKSEISEETADITNDICKALKENRTSQRNRQIVSYFLNILGRAPSASELKSLSNSSLKLYEIVKLLQNANETRYKELTGILYTLFGEIPRKDELHKIWKFFQNEKLSKKEMLVRLAATETFFKKNGSDLKKTIRHMYIALTGSEPKDSELDSLVKQVQNRSKSLKEIAERATSSAAYKARIIRMFFRMHFGRQISGNSFNRLLTALQNGMSEDALRAAILTSPTFSSQSEDLISKLEFRFCK